MILPGEVWQLLQLWYLSPRIHFFVHPTEEVEGEEGVSDCWQRF